jgi:hypothetical protein
MSRGCQKRTLCAVLPVVLLAAVGVWLGALWLARSYDDSPHSLIEEGLYVGRYAPSPPPGTTAVVNLCESKDPYEVEVCLWEPMRDAPPAPAIEWLARVATFIETQRQAGRTVYIHCANGVSRSGLVCIAYLMREHNWMQEQATSFARSKRPEIRPNPEFLPLLGEWEQALQEAAKGPLSQRSTR